MKLNLKNPIIFIDLETTGLNISSDRIVEISCLKVMPDGEEELNTMRINPEIPIPVKVSIIHGITNADVKDAPTFKSIAKDLAAQLEGCDLAGYNSNCFDIPVLAEEFLRAEVDIDLKKRRFIDIQNIFHKKEQRTLSAAFKFYCNKELKDAHSAEGDALASYEILKAQLDKYPDLKNDMIFLSDYSTLNNHVDFAGRIIYNDQKQEVINFGKYKGCLLEDIFSKDHGYYSWVMQGDFPRYTKKVFATVKLRKPFGK